MNFRTFRTFVGVQTCAKDKQTKIDEIKMKFQLKIFTQQTLYSRMARGNQRNDKVMPCETSKNL